MKIARAVAILAAAMTLAACGGSSGSTTTTSTTTTQAPQTQNLSVTSAVRASLLSAGANSHGLAVSDYTGLGAGETFYAYDPSTTTYYAAARLVPSPKSYQAQVSSQDDGGYNLFVRSASVPGWTVYDDGLGGAMGSTCPIVIPASVLAVWGWKANSCYPRG